MKKFLFFFIMMLSLQSFCLAVEVTSPHAIMIDMDTGRILFEKSAYEATYPASTTKILTAILTLENCDLDEMVTASSVAIGSVYSNATIANIQVGETLSVKDLLSTLMVHSANDAAYVLAEHVGGSIESFVSMMNRRAKELGAKDTYFLNPNGLPNSAHKTTAYDMSIFARYAMENFEFFREIVKTVNYALPVTERYTEFYMHQYPGSTTVVRYPNTSTNRIINPSREEYYEEALGIKTGYTNDARYCLVSAAERNNVKVLTVVFGADNWTNLRSDTVNLFEFGFSLLKSEPLALNGTVVGTKKISNGEKDGNILSLVVSKDLRATIHKMEDVSDVKPQISLLPKLKAPIQEGETVGTVSYEVNGNIYTADLIAGNKIEERPPLFENAAAVVQKTASTMLKVVLFVLIAIIVLFVLLVFIRAYIMTKRQRKRARRRYIYNARFR